MTEFLIEKQRIEILMVLVFYLEVIDTFNSTHLCELQLIEYYLFTNI